MTRVLPVPAPARIKTGPRTVSTASRCCGFSELKSGMCARIVIAAGANTSRSTEPQEQCDRESRTDARAGPRRSAFPIALGVQVRDLLLEELRRIREFG